MPHDRFGDLVADPVDRVERKARLLEDHRDGAAAIGGEIAPATRPERRVRRPESCRRCRRGAPAAGASGRAASRSCRSRTRRAAPALSPGRSVRSTPATARSGLAPPTEVDGQAFDLDDRLRAPLMRPTAATGGDWGCPEPGVAIRQAARCAGPTSASAGAVCAQSGSANVQRVWKRQPVGGSIGLGGSPEQRRLLVRRSGSIDGIEASSAVV